MKIAILNFSGNVGKTTIARDVFKQRLSDAELISIETVNKDGNEEYVIRGEDGESIYTEINLNDELILDIGASNLENFFLEAEKKNGLLGQIDTFVVPVPPPIKQQIDTLKTITELMTYKIPSEKIHVVLNMVEPPAPMSPDITEVFEELITAQKAINFNLVLEHPIHAHKLYSSRQSITELIKSDNFLELAKQAKKEGDKTKARELLRKQYKQDSLNQLNETYQDIFNAIMK